MIKEPTVFILGAGASHPYGFPIGKELRKEICFNFPEQYKTWLGKKGLDTTSNSGPYLQAKEFSEAFFKSSDPSIDVWLAKNKEFLKMGKIAIIFRILQAEHDSHFRENLKNQKQDWYSDLWYRMNNTFIEKDDYKKYGENEIDFITFNYDRSLEHFLLESLQNSFYGIGITSAKKELSKRKFIHVYGKIAPLDTSVNIRYGEHINNVVPGNFIDNLTIIHEAGDNSELQEAHRLIKKAKKIFFLGFGYGRENLEILGIPEIIEGGAKVYGTALDWKEKEIEDLEVLLINGLIEGKCTSILTPTDLKIENLDCVELLRKYL